MLASCSAKSSNRKPETLASTAHTRFNALTHGAASKELFLKDENSAEFFDLLHDSFRYYKPANLNESQLITDLTHARWMLLRRRRVHDEISQQLHSAKPLPENWTDEDMQYLTRFDRYLTSAERSHQRALTNVRNMHRDNLRTSQWKQLHELQKQKFDLQRDRFEVAKAREKRASEKHEISQRKIANKEVTEIRSAENAVSSPRVKSIHRHPLTISEAHPQGSSPTIGLNTPPIASLSKNEPRAATQL